MGGAGGDVGDQEEGQPRLRDQTPQVRLQLLEGTAHACRRELSVPHFHGRRRRRAQYTESRPIGQVEQRRARFVLSGTRKPIEKRRRRGEKARPRNIKVFSTSKQIRMLTLRNGSSQPFAIASGSIGDDWNEKVEEDG